MTADLSRGAFARIGVCALNLLLPGLGLVRLARYRLAAIFFGLLVASIVVVLGGYFLTEQLTFDEWAALMGALLALALVAYLGSMVASWRCSRMIEPRPGFAWRWFAILAVWLVGAVLSSSISSLARSRYRPFYVPSEAMLPTINVDDRILADMHAIDPLARGDTVIVHANGEDYVKRVAGLPGDRIALVNGMVVLNGQQVARQLIGKTRLKDDGGEQEATVFREQFAGEARPHLVMDTGPSYIDDFDEITLPSDRYFLLGDNRDHSADSRLPPGFQAGLGIVPRSEITGRIAFRYWRRGSGIGPGRV